MILYICLYIWVVLHAKVPNLTQWLANPLSSQIWKSEGGGYSPLFRCPWCWLLSREWWQYGLDFKYCNITVYHDKIIVTLEVFRGQRFCCSLVVNTINPFICIVWNAKYIHWCLHNCGFLITFRLHRFVNKTRDIQYFNRISVLVVYILDNHISILLSSS